MEMKPIKQKMLAFLMGISLKCIADVPLFLEYTEHDNKCYQLFDIITSVYSCAILYTTIGFMDLHIYICICIFNSHHLTFNNFMSL